MRELIITLICGFFISGCSTRCVGDSDTLRLGEGWHGLSDIFRNAYALKGSDHFFRQVDVPPGGWLEVAIGTKTSEPVTFRIHVRKADNAKGDSAKLIFEKTVRRPGIWQSYTVALDQNARGRLNLDLSVDSPSDGSVGYWGLPLVRRSSSDSSAKASIPKGVILLWVDTLRSDHLDLYGYKRQTAPTLTRIAREGVWFRDAITQSNWTLPATASLLTSTVPSTHGVTDFYHRIPDNIQTLAEVYQRAGYATILFSSILYTGRHANAHQGFDVVHEATSLPRTVGSKTARYFVDRLLPWLDTHRKVPFFVLLHVYDPHSPYRPEPPYDQLWVDKETTASFSSYSERFRDRIDDPLLKKFAIPDRAVLTASGIDPSKYVAHASGWYDGSIKAMDIQIARILVKLEELGIDKETLWVVSSDHGEEFLEHGRMYHGQSLYSEMIQVPLILRWPSGIAAGKVISETAQIIDIMPTLLELSELDAPKGMQGRSLVGSIRGNKKTEPEPVFSERIPTDTEFSPPPRDVYQVAILWNEWKLIRKQDRTDKGLVYELFNRVQDPFDRHDLSKQHPEVIKSFETRIRAWKNQTPVSSRPSEPIDRFELSPKMIDRMRALGYAR